MPYESNISVRRSAYLYKEVLFHLHEIFRREPLYRGSTGNMAKVMFLLTILGLDDECLSMAEFIGSPHNHFGLPDEVQPYSNLVAKLGEEGEDPNVFIFPMRRASDVFQGVFQDEDTLLMLPDFTLVCLLLINLRLADQHYRNEISLNVFRDTPDGRYLAQVYDHIQLYLIDQRKNEQRNELIENLYSLFPAEFPFFGPDLPPALARYLGAEEMQISEEYVALLTDCFYAEGVCQQLEESFLRHITILKSK